MPRAQLSYYQYMYPELIITEDEINNYRLHACNKEYNFIIILITVPHCTQFEHQKMIFPLEGKTSLSRLVSMLVSVPSSHSSLSDTGGLLLSLLSMVQYHFGVKGYQSEPTQMNSLCYHEI